MHLRHMSASISSWVYRCRPRGMPDQPYALTLAFAVTTANVKWLIRLLCLCHVWCRWGNEVVESASGLTRLQRAADVHHSVASILTSGMAPKAHCPFSPDSVAGAQIALSPTGTSPSSSTAFYAVHVADEPAAAYCLEGGAADGGLGSLAVEMAAVSLDGASDAESSGLSGEDSDGWADQRRALEANRLLAISSYRSQQQAAVLARETRACSMAHALSCLHGMPKLEVLDLEGKGTTTEGGMGWRGKAAPYLCDSTLQA